MSRLSGDAESVRPIRVRLIWGVLRVGTTGLFRGGGVPLVAALLLCVVPLCHSAQAQDAFITTWETFSNESITIPTESSRVDSGLEEQHQTDGLTLSTGQSQYTSNAESARQTSIDEHNWTIDDGGLTDIQSVSFTEANVGLTDVYEGSTSIADVDGDGNKDLLITGENASEDPTATLYLGDGQGGFTEAGAGLTGFQDGSISIADVDNDGNPDLLITGITFEPQTQLYLGDGEGEFTQSEVTLRNVHRSSTSIADVDGDGNSDLLITGRDLLYGEPTAILYLGNGEGGFTEAEVGLTGVQRSSTSISDVNEDGSQDLLIAGEDPNSNPTATLYLGNGQGGFTEADADLTGVSASSTSIADIDGDGNQDLLITGHDGNGESATLYLGDGQGNFVTSDADLTGVEFGSTSIGDIDGDSTPDLLITGQLAGGFLTATLYLGDGEGGFTAANADLTPVLASSTSIADVDGDEKTDLLITGSQNPTGPAPTSTLYLNQGSNPGSPSAPENLTATPGDGRVELEWAPNSESDLSGYNVYRSTSSFSDISNATKLNDSPIGNASYTDTEVTGGTEYFYRVTAVGSDGNESDLSGEASAATSSVSFVPFDAGLTGVSSSSTSIGDVDGDGNQDLLITGSAVTSDNPDPTATLYMGDGQGGFNEANVGLTGVHFSSNSIADVNGDGNQDLLITGGGENLSTTATLYLGDGQGGFEEAGAGLTGVRKSSTSIADVNGDGNEDLLITGRDENSDPTATLYLRAGDGTFVEAGAGLTGVYTGSTSIADVNGDGNEDLLITGWDENNDPTATLYLGDGQGGFNEAGVGLTGGGVGSTSIADVDGDGNQDLLITGSDADGWTATLYLGDGQGGFTEAGAGLTGVGSSSTSIADVDGDGNQDLLITGEAGTLPNTYPTATLYENQSGTSGPPQASDFAYPISSTEYATEANDGDGWYNARDFGVSVPARNNQLHLGEDWNAESGGNSDCGLPAYSTAAGTIVYADEAAPSLGKVVVVRHDLPDGSQVESLYAHLRSIAQTSGTVEKREQIGTIGDADGYYTYCHLHFAIRLPSSADWGNPGPGYASSTDGWTDPSDYIGGSTGAPSGLAATPGDGEVSLSWDPLPDGDLDGYNVYRSTSSFSNLSDDLKITDSPVGDPSYTDGDVDQGTTYYYRVTAVGSDGTESGPSSQASASLQKLRLLGLEVNQSVQTWENSVPLVEGKKTIVRAHLQNQGEGSTPVQVKLKGTQDGSPLLGSPRSAYNRDNYEAPPSPSEDSVETIRKRRAEMSESLNFELPSEWLKGTVTLKLIGDSVDCNETPAVNADCELEVTFESVPTPKITVFIIGWNDGDGATHLPEIDSKDIKSIKRRVEGMYPIDNIDIELSGESIIISCPYNKLSCGPPSMDGEESGIFDSRKSVINKLYEKWVDDYGNGAISKNDIYYGFISEVAEERTGAARDESSFDKVAFTSSYPGTNYHQSKSLYGTTLHEISHLHGLEHAVNVEPNGTDGDGKPLGWCGSDNSDQSAPNFPYVSNRIDIPKDDDGEEIWEGFTALGPTNEGLYDEVWGVNTDKAEVVGTSQYRKGGANAELMSYCFAPGSQEIGARWTSDTTYTTLQDKIAERFGGEEEPIIAGATPYSSENTLGASSTNPEFVDQQEYLLVKGLVGLEEDSLKFHSFSTITTTPDRADVIAPSSGEYTLQALDESGTVVREASFEPAVAVAKTTSDIGSFTIPIQSDPAIEEVQVLGGADGNGSSNKSSLSAPANNNVLGSRTASPNPPTVTIQYPNGGEDLGGDEVTLQWTASDPDEDSLSYTVEYSRDDGSTWKALATSWPRDSLTVNASALGGTSDGLIRVQASDGFNTAQDESDGTFGAANVPPSASIFSPSDGAVTGQSGFITLDGSGSDTEDGSLSGSALKWQTASGDSLGIGETIDVSAANFSIGTHEVELVATDSAGAADTASVSIQVALSNGPSLLASTSVLVETDSLYDLGSTGVSLNVDSTTGSGTVTAELYDSAPIGTSDIPQSNVSKYRVLISAGNDLTIGPGAEVRFEADTLGGITDPTKVQIYRRPAPGNGPFSALDAQVDSMGTPEDPSDDVIFARVDGFGEFVLASNSQPLPVELSGFEATLDGSEAVRLTWTTTRETGNASFRVQRREGDEESPWTTVGSVEGAGTTTEAKSYRYVDENLPYEADQLTYRLKQVDTDGSASYSEEVTVDRSVKEVELLGTYPNPAQSRATLRYAVPEQQDVKIYLYDILGRRVQTVVDGEREGRHKRQLNVSRLASGVYFLRLRAEGKTRTQKLTIVR